MRKGGFVERQWDGTRRRVMEVRVLGKTKETRESKGWGNKLNQSANIGGKVEKDRGRGGRGGGRQDMAEGRNTAGWRRGKEEGRTMRENKDVGGSDNAPRLQAVGEASGRVRSGWEIKEPSVCWRPQTVLSPWPGRRKLYTVSPQKLLKMNSSCDRRPVLSCWALKRNGWGVMKESSFIPSPLSYNLQRQQHFSPSFSPANVLRCCLWEKHRHNLLNILTFKSDLKLWKYVNWELHWITSSFSQQITSSQIKSLRCLLCSYWSQVGLWSSNSTFLSSLVHLHWSPAGGSNVHRNNAPTKARKKTMS